MKVPPGFSHRSRRATADLREFSYTTILSEGGVCVFRVPERRRAEQASSQVNNGLV